MLSDANVPVRFTAQQRVKYLLDSMLHKVGGAFLFQHKYELKLLDLKDLPVFYKNVLAVWQELSSSDPIDPKEIQQKILWNNRFILISPFIIKPGLTKAF